jgi:hypothetical protein
MVQLESEWGGVRPVGSIIGRISLCRIRPDMRAGGRTGCPERTGISRIRRPVAVARWHDDADRGVGHETAMGQQARTDEDFEPLSTDGLEVVEARDADTVRLFLREWRRRVILDRAARPARTVPDARPGGMMRA